MTSYYVAVERARAAASAGLVSTFLALLLGAALATATPAAALDDPTRPDVRVTFGPSCRPGGLVVEVVAGTSPYFVRLVPTRTPPGENDAMLRAGETVVLRSADVAYGETIDGRPGVHRAGRRQQRKDGNQSNFFRLERPDREDA